MYTGDYHTYYLELQERFPNVMIGIQHSDKHARLTVNIFGSEEDAKDVLEYVKDDPAFVLATKVEDKDIYRILFTDNNDRDKLRGVLRYFLGEYAENDDLVNKWFSESFVDVGVMFEMWKH